MKSGLKRKIEEEEFNEIKTAQESGLNSVELASEFELSLVQINKIFSAKDWQDYCKTSRKETLQAISEDADLVKPYERGYLRGALIETSGIESIEQTNTSMSKQLLVLRQQIKASWDMISLLEKRKDHLNKEIQNMENYIQSGINLVETHLEE